MENVVVGDRSELGRHRRTATEADKGGRRILLGWWRMNGLLAVGLQIWAIQVGSDGSPNLPSVFCFCFFFQKKKLPLLHGKK
jgi:hypothetical protein